MHRYAPVHIKKEEQSEEKRKKYNGLIRKDYIGIPFYFFFQDKNRQLFTVFFYGTKFHPTLPSGYGS